MRTRRKLTAIGALALAGSAIAGGALITSHAMADGGTPTKGTLTIVSMQGGVDSAIQCTYDDVELPALASGARGSAASTASGVVTNAVGVAPDAGTPLPVGGAISLQPGTATAVASEAGTSSAGAGEGTSGLPTLRTEGAPPPGDLPVFTLTSGSVRPGTADECAALEPTVTPPTP